MKVEGDPSGIRLPIFGGDASHGSHRVVAPMLPSLPSLPLEVGPLNLNTAREFGGAL